MTVALVQQVAPEVPAEPALVETRVERQLEQQQLRYQWVDVCRTPMVK